MKILAMILALGTLAMAQQKPTQLGLPSREELEILFGADVGKGGTDGQDDIWSSTTDVAQACTSAGAILKHAYARASGTGHPELQRTQLVRGLQRALAAVNGSWGFEPLTKRALERGLRVNQLISSGCDNYTSEAREICLDLENRTANYAVSRLYIWVLRNIIPLDQNYYIPYKRNHFPRCQSLDCLPNDFRNPFVTAYSESAAAWLDFYLGKRSDGSRLPEAFSKDSYEIKIAEFVSLWAAVDLNSDLMRRAYGCMIGELRTINQTLRNYKDEFSNSKQAVEFARHQLGDVSSWLRSAMYCQSPGFPGFPGSPR